MKNYNNITKIKLTSEEAADQFEDDSLDMVYIDADHSYQEAIADCRAWYPKVKPGGIFAGHDFQTPQVRKAVREMAAEKGKDIYHLPDFDARISNGHLHHTLLTGKINRKYVLFLVGIHRDIGYTVIHDRFSL